MIPQKTQKTVSEQWRHQALVARHSSRTIYKVVYISIKEMYVGYAATRWRHLLSNSPKTNARR